MYRHRFSGALGAVLGFLLLVGGAVSASAQAPTVITGRVTGDEGQPLAGARIMVVGTNIGTATTVTGTYTLPVSSATARGQTVTLTVRFVGYQALTREVQLTPGTQTQNFEMVADPFRLDEVIVTGVVDATSQKKLAISVGMVTESQLQNVPAKDAISALVGKVSGAKVSSGSGRPGLSSQIRLRSATSLTDGADQQPLIIVDGVLTQGSLADINVQDIERIEVLKGPAGGSLYGSSAASGVVQIFTKRGKNGAEGKTNVVYRGEYGQSGVVKFIDVNKSHYYELNPDGSYKLDGNGNRIIEANGLMDNPYPGPVSEHQRDMIGNGEFFSNYVSVSRRQGGTNFFASMEMLRNKGIIEIPQKDFDGYVRNNVRFGVDQILSDRLDVSLGGFYNVSTNDQQFQQGGPFFNVLQYPVDVDLFKDNDNGQPYKVNVGLEGAILSGDPNPLYVLYTNDWKNERTRVQGSFRGRWRPLDWLSFEGTYAYDRTASTTRTYVPKGTLNASGTEGLGSLAIADGVTRAYNANITARASQRFGELNTAATLSYFYEDVENTFNNGAAQNFTSVDVPTLDNLNPSTRNVSSSQSTIRARNAAAAVLLDYRDRYIVDASVRRDGSSLFGPDARWRTFYRASAAWRISEDLPIGGVDEWRVRYSRGTAGLRPFFEAQYETFTVGGGNITPGVLGNRNLKPAYSTENEYGMNLDFLERFTLEYTYSTKVTEDQIILIPFSSVAGFSGQWQNAGTLSGNTHEIAFGAQLLNTRDWSWQMNLTWDRSRQKVTALNRAEYQIPEYTQTGNPFVIKEGESYGAMYGYKWVRSFEQLKENPANANAVASDYVVNEDGLLVLAANKGTPAERPIRYIDANGEDTFKIGDANPNFNFGFQQTISYKGLAMSSLVDWVQGGEIYNQPRQWVARAEFRSKEFDQAGKPDDAKKAYQYYNAFNLANEFNEWYVEDGSYARLRELSLNYTFSPDQLGKLGLGRLMSGLRIGVVGRNLITLTDYTGMDPEVSNVVGQADATTFRFDAFGYPNYRTVSFLVEIGF